MGAGLRWFGGHDQFRDRREAGRRLATLLSHYAHRDDVLVLALPRGGVPVAFEVARALDAPLDVWLVRKLGVPGREELALGAIADGGARVLNNDVITALRISLVDIDQVTVREQRELERRQAEYRGVRPPPRIAGKNIIVVDDGLATGSTMRAAAESLRSLDAGRVIVAVAVAPESARSEFRQFADEFYCVIQPKSFRAVGLWYEDFSPTTDDEVRALVAEASQPREPLESV